jgi:hypothetical protein
MIPNYLVEKEGKQDSRVATKMRIVLDFSKLKTSTSVAAAKFLTSWKALFFLAGGKEKQNVGEEPLPTEPGWLLMSAAIV